MRKTLAVIIAVAAMLAGLGAGFYSKEPTIEIGTSDLYTQAEIQSAIDIVENKFTEFKGCRLFKLSYAGDADSLKEFTYNENYNEAIVINSKFLSPIFGGGAWNSHEIYTWHFILMRDDGGEWDLLTYGYC